MSDQYESYIKCLGEARTIGELKKLIEGFDDNTPWGGVGMKERPILFSSSMVRAILEGRKTQTRRTIKELLPDTKWRPGKLGEITSRHPKRGRYGVLERAPILKNFDRWREFYFQKRKRPWDPNKWRSSMFMPRWASRIDLEITDIRVERLNDISEEGAIAEGMSHDGCAWFVPGNAKTGAQTATECFAQLWDSINGKAYPWDSSQWVWVIKFKRV